ncbi:MAG: quinohemoprotein ethanol dehydrogenase [Gaiellales bacterium]|nr:quinohemoprotein ethanol dehydrogenase [Gaiellales bacterium]
MRFRSTRRRSIAALLIVLPMALALSGCGGGSSDGDTSTPATGGDTTTGGAATGDPAAGKIVFTETANPSCTGCHTLADAGATGTAGPNLDELMPSFERVKAQVENGGGVMPAYKGKLSDQEINDVAAYVSSVAGK